MVIRKRAQAIIIQNNKVLFGLGLFGNGDSRHFFIGGGIENHEIPEETVLRELKEETGVEGEILFEISGVDMEYHHTFLVGIGKQIPVIGYDPEQEEMIKPFEKKMLQKLVFLDLLTPDNFTSIDIQAFEALLLECKKRKYEREWFPLVENIVENKKGSIREDLGGVE